MYLAVGQFVQPHHGASEGCFECLDISLECWQGLDRFLVCGAHLRQADIAPEAVGTAGSGAGAEYGW